MMTLRPLPALRPLTKQPPANFHHKPLFLALNSALNVVPADFDVNNPTDHTLAEMRQLRNDASVATQSAETKWFAQALGQRQRAETGPIKLQQVNEDFDIAQYWSRPADSIQYYTPQKTILNQVLTVPTGIGTEGSIVNPEQFLLAIGVLNDKIRAKKVEKEAFNDLFFAELYLASMSLAALIMNNRSVWDIKRNQVPHPMPKEMDLLTRMVALTNAILDDPHNLALAAQASALQCDLAQHLKDYYVNDPLARQTSKVAFYRNILRVAMWTSLILSCMTLVAGAVCLATACPPSGIILVAAAICFIGGMASGACGLYFDISKSGEKFAAMKDSVQRSRERQVAIGMFFYATNELIDKDLPEVPTPNAGPSQA